MGGEGLGLPWEARKENWSLDAVARGLPWVGGRGKVWRNEPSIMSEVLPDSFVGGQGPGGPKCLCSGLCVWENR